MIVIKFKEIMPLKSIWNNVGARLGIPMPELKSGSTLNMPRSGFG